MRSALFRGMTQHMVAIRYWCFGTTYWTQLQDSRNPRNYHHTLCNVPEECRSQYYIGVYHFWENWFTFGVYGGYFMPTPVKFRFTWWILVGDATVFPMPSKLVECFHRWYMVTRDLSLIHLIFALIVWGYDFWNKIYLKR